MQTERYRMVGVKLEGMTADELQDEFKIRTSVNRQRADAGVQLPAGHHRQHLRGVQRRPDHATGYSAALGVPTGRYIRPAASPAASRSTAATAARQDINLNGPLFSRGTCG